MVSENGHTYFVHQTGGGDATVFSDKGATYIQNGPMGARIINTGRSDAGAISAALLTRPTVQPLIQHSSQDYIAPNPTPYVPTPIPLPLPFLDCDIPLPAARQMIQVSKMKAQDKACSTEFKKLTNCMSPSTLVSFRKDMASDMGVKKGDRLSPKEANGYAKLWVRTHTNSTSR
jgi:hypothetical protein